MFFSIVRTIIATYVATFHFTVAVMIAVLYFCKAGSGSVLYRYLHSQCINPLVPSVLNIEPLAKILIQKVILKKKFLWASRLWVGRRKEPILSYVTKNGEKKIWAKMG